MNYIVFDLEFNQNYNWEKEDKSISNPKCPFEIIQIGAVRLDENLQIISSFDSLIKPQLYTSIHPFVKEITGITLETLSYAKPFDEVYKKFVQFVQNDSILCVWGMCDIKELFRNIEYHKLDTSLISKEYINLQSYASRYLNCAKGTNISLHNAVELLNIDFKNQFHNAFNDAYYTAKIFKKIYNKEIKCKIYNSNKHIKLNNNKKRKVNTLKLISQFEKMFDRKFSEEEQSIIKLAYFMGKTNQFHK